MSMQQVLRARQAHAKAVAANMAYALAHPPTGPKVYIFPAGSGVGPYTWSPEMNAAALAGVTMYLQPTATGGGADVIWPQPMGSGIVAQYPAQARSGGAAWVQGVIADKLKSANVGVLGGTFDKVAPYIGAALLAYVTAGMASEFAASSAASSGAASAAPSSASLSTGLSSTTAAGGADLTVTGLGGSASLNTGLSNIVSTSLSGGDIVTASANLATGGSLTAGSSLAAGGLGGALGTAAVPLGMTAQGVSDLSLLSPTGTSLAQPLAVSDYVQQAAQTLNQGLTTAQAGMKAIATAKVVQSALSGPKPLGPQPMASQAPSSGVASPTPAKSPLNAILLAVASYLMFS